MELLVLCLFSVFGCISLVADSHSSHRFGYSKKEQKLWREHSENCSGQRQSPINIVSHQAVQRPLPALEMLHYHNLLPMPLNLTNTGHSVSLKSESGNENELELPQVFGALLPDMYVLDSFHFHWGQHNARGSEHIMNGIRFPVEMHIIHRNKKYDSMNDVHSDADGLTVLAFFFQVQEKNNVNLNPILKYFKYVHKPHDTVLLNKTFTLASLLETDLDVFYTYHGSLTTPPCSEAVTWIVFPDPLRMSFRQMKKFRRLSSGKPQMTDNYRMIQPLNERVVYVRKMWKFNENGRNITKVNSVSWIRP